MPNSQLYGAALALLAVLDQPSGIELGAWRQDVSDALANLRAAVEAERRRRLINEATRQRPLAMVSS